MMFSGTKEHPTKKIVVVGGGFAGLQLLKNLNDKHYELLLIDRINHHQFQPLFYQVATSQLEPSSISFPFRNILKKRDDVQIRLAEVTSIDPDNNKIQSSIGEINYDHLVLAHGCTTNYFGNREIEDNSYSLKSTYDAINIRNRILQSFEKMVTASEEELEGLQNLVIVGAGPTGVELAGAFAEIKNCILPKDYPGLDFTKFQIILIEGSENTLNNMSDKSKEASRKYLLKMGVTLMMETFVKHYDGEFLETGTGQRIKTKNVIWAAGVTGNRIKGLPDDVYVKGNRIEVNRINQVRGYENIFALGDIASMKTPKFPGGHPQLANVAINQAKLLAKNLKRIANGRQPEEFEYRDLGSMATIGKNKAVVDLPGWSFKGFFAWLVWMFLHLMLILSVRNKLIIFINWAWTYLTRDTSLSLILTGGKNKNGGKG